MSEISGLRMSEELISVGIVCYGLNCSSLLIYTGYDTSARTVVHTAAVDAHAEHRRKRDALSFVNHSHDTDCID